MDTPAKSFWDAAQQLKFDQPLEADDPRRVNTAPARGDFTFNDLRRLLGIDPATERMMFEPDRVYALFCGHRGCGKSVVGLAACGMDDNGDIETAVAAAPAATMDAGPETTIDGGAPMMPDEGPIPSEPESLLAWLEGGGYLQWDAESGPHQSTGPHFGQVRTFVEPSLLESLAAGNTAHPAGAATVKELYGDGVTIRGWSVSIKLQADSAAGNGWFWYERYQGSVYASRAGAPLCTGCHNDGLDYVLTPFPLQ